MLQYQKIRVLLSLLIYCFSFGALFSQDLNTLSDLVADNNKKAIEKAENSLAEAGKLTQEANNYYNEALALQSNYELDEKTLQKKLAKTEAQAVATQIKADKVYADAYKSLFELCETNLKESKISYGESGSLEATAADMMEQAKSKRKDANNASNAYEKAALLNEAASLEGAAIDNMILSLQIQQGISPTPTVQETEQQSLNNEYEESYTSTPSYSEPASSSYSNSVEQKSENLAIDHNVVNKYTEYVNDPAIPDPIMVNRSGVSGVSDISVDMARQILNYEDSPQTEDTSLTEEYLTPESQLAIQDTLTNIIDVEYSDKLETEEVEVVSVESYDLQTEPIDLNYDQEEATTESANEARNYMDISSVRQSSGVSFAVQIAASKVPLTRSQMKAIYPGNHTIEVIEEGGWVKYHITGFKLFSDANKAAIESGVTNAWVISRANGNLIGLPEAREITRVLETDVKRYGRSALVNETDFFVQTAASRLRFDDAKRREFCGGVNMCREIIEENWFKYQIYSGTDYDTALRLKNTLGADAFVVAYERGSKVELYEAINKKK